MNVALATGVLRVVLFEVVGGDGLFVLQLLVDDLAFQHHREFLDCRDFHSFAVHVGKTEGLCFVHVAAAVGAAFGDKLARGTFHRDAHGELGVLFEEFKRIAAQAHERGEQDLVPLDAHHAPRNAHGVCLAVCSGGQQSSTLEPVHNLVGVIQYVDFFFHDRGSFLLYLNIDFLKFCIFTFEQKEEIMNGKKNFYGVLVAAAALCGAAIFAGCGDDSSTSVNDEQSSSSVDTPASSADAKSSSSSKEDKTAGSSSSVKDDESSSSAKGGETSEQSSSSEMDPLVEKLGECEDKGQFEVRHVQDSSGNWYSCYRGEWTEGFLEVEGPEWGHEPDDLSSSSATKIGEVLVDSRDGESYKTVYIGKQHWMAENLRYRADKSDTLKAGRYGRYYSWATAMDTTATPCNSEMCKFARIQRQGVCPNGWHIPSIEEWQIFIDELEKLSTKPFEIIADGDDWQTSSGNNSTGFTAVPAGIYSGGATYRSNQAHIWSSSVAINGRVFPDYAHYLRISEKGVRIETLEKFANISVRCIENSEESEQLDYLNRKEYSGTYGELVDPRDGKKYKTVVLDGLEWMAENLNFETEKSVCGVAADSCAKFGRLYPDSEYRSVCPTGWRIPKGSEVDALIPFDGFRYVIGHYMKSTSGWVVNDSLKEGYDGNGSNAFGLNILPQGFYSDSLSYIGVYKNSAFRIDRGEADEAFVVRSDIKEGWFGQSEGYYIPVRCVKD